MSVSAKDVKRLRDMTGVGMMDCKQALAEADGDFDRAVEILRKKGQKVAAKRADRDANEGLIVVSLNEGGTTAAMAEVNCETDFVARNDDFAAFARDIVELVLREHPTDLEALHATSYNDGRTVGEALTDMTGKIGEKIDVRRFAIMSSDRGSVVSYIHPGSRLGVLVEVSGDGNLSQVGTDVAMQTAALNPLAVSRDEVPAEIQEKEMEIARETARNEGKPDNILDRIAQGKLDRFFKDHVLLEQPFVKDSSTSVGDMVKKEGATVHRFIRFSLGD